ncbi:MAG: phosphatase PAP2 family protein [Acidimicrobiales bacterium]
MAAVDTARRSSGPEAGPDARTRWWTQGLLIAVVWWAYDAVNNLAPLRGAAALAHGAAILRLETILHLDAERGLNRWLGSHLLVGRWMSSYYNTAHFAVTIAVLGWVWVRHHGDYRPLRNGLLGINLIGFLVYWAFPVAPPRMLAGFTDIAEVAHTFGVSTTTLASQANEYAAMPSLHVAWALWCALAVWVVSRDRRYRVVAAGHVALTTVVVLATANHYLLDVVAGVLTTAAACSVVPLATLWQPTRVAPASSPSGAGAEVVDEDEVDEVATPS